jgi:hypothetical protein
MHEREFPNTTAAGEHGTGHGPATSDTHTNEGGAHAPENAHGDDGHEQRHTDIDTSERTDVMKTTNKITSTGAALSLALFAILVCSGSTSAFTVGGGGGNVGLGVGVTRDGGSITCDGGDVECGECGDQLSGTFQGSQGGTLRGGLSGTAKGGTRGGSKLTGEDGYGQSVGATGGGDCTTGQIIGGGTDDGGTGESGTGGSGFTEEGTGGTGCQGLDGGAGGSGGGQSGPDGSGS